MWFICYLHAILINNHSLDAQVLSMHLAAEKFVSLIPSIISEENLQTLEAEETIDVSLTSKLRILTGEMIFLILKPHFLSFSKHLCSSAVCLL